MTEWDTTEQTPEGVVAQPVESYPFWTYQDLAFFVGLALPSLIGAALLVKLIIAASGWKPPGQAFELLPAQFLGYAFWFASLYLLLKLRYGRPFWVSLAWVRPFADFWKLASSGVLLAFGVAVASTLLRTPEMDMPIQELLGDSSSIVVLTIFGTTLGPLCEELAFRGFLLPLLIRSVNVVPGIFLAALPFAFLHGPQYAWSWRHLLLITLVGAAFGWVRYRTGSTAAAVVAHAAYNLTFFVALFFQTKELPI